ncbi:hypothetical protein H101_04366, partial [Trichophyton interdigitale H6]
QCILCTFTSHPDGRDSTVLIEGTVGGSGGRRAASQQPKTTPERRTLFNLRAPPDGDHLHCLGYAELMMPWPEYILPLVRESDIHNSLWRTGGAARSCNSPTATPATESTSLQLTRTLFDDYSV